MTLPSPKGLPERLPEGERLLWQGAPSARALLRHTFHVRAMAVYFGLILALSAATIVSHGASAHEIRLSLLHRVLLAAVPFVLVGVYAWAIQRSTVYSITSHRVVISCGIALPVTFNIPFSRIAAAGLRYYSDRTGDIPLQLRPDEAISYFVVWPHVRPWRIAHAEPMLRCMSDAQAASHILGAALAEHEALLPARMVPLKSVRMPSGFRQDARAVAAE